MQEETLILKIEALSDLQFYKLFQKWRNISSHISFLLWFLKKRSLQESWIQKLCFQNEIWIFMILLLSQHIQDLIQVLSLQRYFQQAEFQKRTSLSQISNDSMLCSPLFKRSQFRLKKIKLRDNLSQQHLNRKLQFYSRLRILLLLATRQQALDLLPSFRQHMWLKVLRLQIDLELKLHLSRLGGQWKLKLINLLII